MERIGEVTRVDGKWLEITFCRPSDCDKCHACMGGNQTTTLRLQGKAKVGDKALVSMPDSTITQASLIAYGLPLAGLLIGMLAGDAFIPVEHSLGAVIGGAGGLVIPLIGLIATERSRKNNPKWCPQLVRVIPMGQNE